MTSESGQVRQPPSLGGTPAEAVGAELSWRSSAWRILLSSHPAMLAPAARVREIGLYSGFRGVWVDKRRTASVWAPSGITIGVRHDGSTYADTMSDTGLIYKFPKTEMPGYDQMEVEATRTAMLLGLPIFVISGHKDDPMRDVRLAYVEACNDEAHEFLLSFVDAPTSVPAVSRSSLTLMRAPTSERSMSRANDRRFAFEVVERYGPACAVCAMTERAILRSAHLRPKFAKGTDDPRNGLVLCANHHLAMNTGLWRVHPEAQSVIARPGVDLNRIGITRVDLSRLRARPSIESLEWLWKLNFRPVNSAHRPRRSRPAASTSG